MEPATHPTLLVLRALKLGDLLVAVPALKGLRSRFPKHRLLLAAPEWLRPIVDLLDVVDGLIPLPDLAGTLPRSLKGIDIAVNLHGNGSESRALLERLQPLHLIGHAAPGWNGAPWQPEMQERERWVRMLKWHGIAANADDVSIAIPPHPAVLSGATVIHVGASHGSRQWPVARFAAVAQTLQENGAAVVLTGDARDAARSGEVARLAGLDSGQDLAGRLPLADFAALIASAAVVVSADTGAAHLASAYGTPSVVLFGPAPQSQWGPPRGPHLVLTDESLRQGDVFSDIPDPALLAVRPQEVLSAVASLIRAVDAPRVAR
ncbi:glycosyl transferase [Arthrobacter psychrolactophilus]|uniref:Glycosyl transferase n=1 Tax=Arthrobacter psychrolactophilus TaxID=92442 RepID=A0A2V5JJD3_9MICC|nr:glycosyltransferase family 9 protein [Arthrobacter psychrolactophilus]PYI37276.1 glycosyl transferase [Arthrobacter psychrolactophilus]